MSEPTEHTSLPATFLTHAASILADTTRGLSGSVLIDQCSAFAVEFNANIPHTSVRFDAPNKRTALKENLLALPPVAQYRLLKQLCEHQSFKDNSDAQELKVKLASTYGHLDSSKNQPLTQSLINEAKHWLSTYQGAHQAFIDAEQKYRHKLFTRNLLDDLRLSLELLLKELLSNDKPLEKQLPYVGDFLKQKGTSKEFRNMFNGLLDYFAKYQNAYVKHDDAVVEEEVEFIFELTASFQKHLIRIKLKRDA